MEIKPLSPFKYYSANPKKFALLCMVLALAVCAVSFVSAMLTGYLNDNYVCLEGEKYFSYVSPAKGEKYLSSGVISEVSAYSEVADTLTCSVQTTLYQGLVAGIASGVYTMKSAEDTERMLNCVGDSLAEGRLPSFGAMSADEVVYEVIMHERLLKNKGLSVGDIIGSDVNSLEGLQGKFLIVGKISGPVLISFANYNPSVVAADGVAEAGVNALILLPKEGGLSAINQKLQSLEKERVSISTYDYYYGMMRGQTTTLYVLAVAIVAVVSLILAISLGSLIYITYSSRMDEFGILYTLGYSQRKLKGMITAEIFITAIIGWAVGYILFTVILAIINAAMLAPRGQALSSFDWFGLLSSLIIPAVVAVCAVIPVARKLKKTDIISVIERTPPWIPPFSNPF